jgi:hypothetical protein
MSFDFGVWYPQKRLNNEEASALYARLCDNDLSGVVAHPAVDEFYEELVATFPEIDTVPEEKSGDFKYCPWSCRLDRSPGHVITSCVFSEVASVEKLVETLARKHGLAVFDPQSDRITYPDGSTEPARSSAAAFWILGFFALLFSAMFVYSVQIDPSTHPTIGYVFAGLFFLMAVACFRQAIRRNSRRDSVRASRQEN